MQLYVIQGQTKKAFHSCFTATTQPLMLTAMAAIELHWKCYSQNLGWLFSGALYANFNIARVESFPSRVRDSRSTTEASLLDEVAENRILRPPVLAANGARVCSLPKNANAVRAVCTSDPWENALTRPSIHACLSQQARSPGKLRHKCRFLTWPLSPFLGTTGGDRGGTRKPLHLYKAT